MKKILSYVVFLLSIILVITFSFFKLGTDKISSESDENLEETLKFREMFNLHTNISEIQKIDKKSEEYGVYLTAEEEMDLKERFLHQDNDIKQVKQYLQSNFSDDESSGVYVNQQKGGILNIGFTNRLNDSDDKVVKARSFFKDNTLSPYEINFDDYSEEELNSTYKRIVKDMVMLREKNGIIIYFTTVNIPNNTVELHIKDLTDENIKFLTGTYGDTLDIKKGEKPVDH